MRVATVAVAIVAMFVYGVASQLPAVAQQAGSGGAGAVSPGVAAAASPSTATSEPSSVATGAYPLDMQVRVGFGGRCRLGSWAPLRVVLKTGSGRVDGSLRITVPGDGRFSGAGSKTSYVYPLALPTNSVYEAKLVIPVEERSRPLEVEAEAGGAILARQVTDLARVFTDHALVVAVAGEARKLPPGLASAAAAFATCETPADDLPEDPLGYEGVLALVLPLPCAARLSDARLAAVESWVRQGGALVLFSEAGVPLPLPPVLSGLVPVEVSGETVVESFPSLGRRYAGDSAAQGPAVVLTGRLKRGANAIVEDSGVPLVVAANKGAGEIVLMAFDPSSAPFCNWTGLARLWQETLPRDLEDMQVSLEDIARSILKTTRVLHPSVRPLLGFAGAYVLTVLVILILLGRATRSPYALAAGTCAATVLFSALAWHAAVPLARRTTTAISSITVIESRNRSGTARVRTHVAVLPFSDRLADFAFQGPEWHIASDGSARGPGPGRELEVTCGRASCALRSLYLRAQETTMFHGEAVVPFALHATSERMQDGLTVAVRNDTGLLLEGASILVGDRAARIGTIPHGGVTTVSFSGPSAFADALQEVGVADSGKPTGLWTKSQANLAQALIDELVVPYYLRKRHPDGTHIQTSSPVLIAWAPRYRGSFTVSRLGAHRTEVALVILHLSDMDQDEVASW